MLDRLAAIADQVDDVVAVDDGSGPVAQAVLEDIAAAGHTLIRSGSNRGIAAALNAGIRHALAQDADYVLTIDQDSALPADYVAQCLRVFDGTVPATRIGVVCADRINGAPSLPPRFTPEGFGVVDEAIQSGFLISAQCLRTCGLFDEGLFIDCVDTEFCLRIGDHGFRIAIARGTDLEHELGWQAPLRPFGIQRHHDGVPMTFEYHGPVRRYFIVRNNIELWLRYRNARPRWVAAAVRREISPGVRHLVGGPHRFKQTLAAMIGTVDGLRRVNGPMRRNVRRLLTPARRADPVSATSAALERPAGEGGVVAQVDAGGATVAAPFHEVERGVDDQPIRSASR